jgi:hypothetical protein
MPPSTLPSNTINSQDNSNYMDDGVAAASTVVSPELWGTLPVIRSSNGVVVLPNKQTYHNVCFEKAFPVN